MPDRTQFMETEQSIIRLKGNASSIVHFSTIDHKPTNPEERERIINAGGVVLTARINGSLAVSRALGDFDYK